ncbi:hypothetical protein NXC14_PC00390 (plasmid) [Rhizobium sp. NXC14]|nr:hypothetical protein NXC14_PC00390 [Rhizobium sp. NXC14]
MQPDPLHQPLRPDRQSLGIVSVSYSSCFPFRGRRAHIETVILPHHNRNSWKSMHCAGMEPIFRTPA